MTDWSKWKDSGGDPRADLKRAVERIENTGPAEHAGGVMASDPNSIRIVTEQGEWLTEDGGFALSRFAGWRASVVGGIWLDDAPGPAFGAGEVEALKLLAAELAGQLCEMEHSTYEAGERDE